MKLSIIANMDCEYVFSSGKKGSPGKLRFESGVGYPHWKNLKGWDPTVGFPTQSCFVCVALSDAGHMLTVVEAAKGSKTYRILMLLSTIFQ